MQLDCVVKMHRGVRRYIVSAIGYTSSFACSYAYKELSSQVTSDFIDKLLVVAPFKISRIQTDNGGEFHDKFYTKLAELNITHFWNYVRKPIYNGKIERYNRTIQEEYIDPNLMLLFEGIPRFNHELTNWLLYYNTKRPHFNHRDPIRPNIQIPPLRAYTNMLKLNPEESRRFWTHTHRLQFWHVQRTINLTVWFIPDLFNWEKSSWQHQQNQRKVKKVSQL